MVGDGGREAACGGAQVFQLVQVPHFGLHRSLFSEFVSRPRDPFPCKYMPEGWRPTTADIPATLESGRERIEEAYCAGCWQPSIQPPDGKICCLEEGVAIDVPFEEHHATVSSRRRSPHLCRHMIVFLQTASRWISSTCVCEEVQQLQCTLMTCTSLILRQTYIIVLCKGECH